MLNLQGRVFMPAIDDPYQVIDRLLGTLSAEADAVAQRLAAAIRAPRYRGLRR